MTASWDEGPVDLDGLQERGLGLAGLASRPIERRQIDQRLRPFAVEPLRGNIFIERDLEALAVGGAQLLLGLAGEGPGGLHSHDADLVGEQRRQQGEAHARVGVGECGDGGGAHARIGVLQSLRDDPERRWRRKAPEARNRARPRDRRLGRILGDLHELRLRARSTTVGQVEGFGEALVAAFRRRVPRLDRVAGPGGRLVAVALIAGVGSAEEIRLIGPRNAHRVVVAGIDDHVGRRRHMAGGARGALGAGPMMVMRGCIERLRRVTLGTDGIAGRAQLLRVRVVAIRAGHAGGVHAALEERGVGVNLVALLPVDVEEPRLEE